MMARTSANPSGSRVLAYACAQAWALHRPVMEQLRTVVERHASGVELDELVVDGIVAERDRRAESSPGASRPGRGMSLDPSEREMWYMEGSVMVVPVEGLLCKYASMVNRISCPEGMTPADLEHAIGDGLASAPGATHVVLAFDSPGGTVAGGSDFCEVIRAARAVLERKGVPLIAFARDLCCSAAYLAASNCDEIYCTPNAVIGSIGVCSCMVDSSAASEAAGVRVQLIASGDAKGGGVYDGAKVTPAHLASEKATVQAMADWFVDVVAEGRKMDQEQAMALATGAVWVGAAAMKVGLVDGVAGWNEFLDGLNAEPRASK